jgi:hypothetical protein
MAIKKVSKKTTSKLEPKQTERPAIKRLDQAEMRKLEEFSSAFNYAKSQSALYDQYAANVILKKEKLEAEIKLLDYELNRARELQQREADKMKSSYEKLQIIGTELKSKYNIKCDGHIKYNDMTGEIIDN